MSSMQHSSRSLKLAQLLPLLRMRQVRRAGSSPPAVVIWITNLSRSSCGLLEGSLAPLARCTAAVGKPPSVLLAVNAMSSRSNMQTSVCPVSSVVRHARGLTQSAGNATYHDLPHRPPRTTHVNKHDIRRWYGKRSVGRPLAQVRQGASTFCWRQGNHPACWRCCQQGLCAEEALLCGTGVVQAAADAGGPCSTCRACAEQH